jgi:hypothetical protein
MEGSPSVPGPEQVRFLSLAQRLHRKTAALVASGIRLGAASVVVKEMADFPDVKTRGLGGSSPPDGALHTHRKAVLQCPNDTKPTVARRPGTIPKRTMLPERPANINHGSNPTARSLARGAGPFGFHPLDASHRASRSRPLGFLPHPAHVSHVSPADGPALPQYQHTRNGCGGRYTGSGSAASTARHSSQNGLKREQSAHGMGGV